MQKQRPFRVLSAGLVTVALVVSACSDGDDGDDTGSDTEPATSPSDPDGSEDGENLDGDGLTIGLIRAPVGLFDLLGSAQAGGVALAAQDIAAAGGVLGGPLTIVEDTPTPDRDITAVFTDLVDGGARLLVGPSSSDEALALIPLLPDAGAVVCGASTTAPYLTAVPEGEGRFVRTALDDNVTALHTFQRLQNRTADVLGRPPQITVVAREDSYGTSLSGSLAGLLSLSGMVATVVPYGPDDVQLAGVADAVAASTPDEVVLISLEEGPRLASLLVAAGIDPDKLLGLDGQATPRFAEQGSPGSPETLNGASVIGTSGPLPFMARLLDVPEGRAQVLYGAQAYDCAISFALAAEATGSTDPDGILAALPEVTGGGTICTSYADCVALLRDGEDIDYEGPSGPIDIDETGEPGGGRFLTANVVDGAMRVVVDLRFDLAEYRAQVAPRLVAFIASVQTALAELGYYNGPIDGQFNDEFRAALVAFQTDNGLEPTGEIDAETLAAIQANLDIGSAALTASITEIQQLLTDLGYFTGPIDGRVTPALGDAIRAFQIDLGVEPTGILDAATLRAIYQAGVQSGTPVEPPEPPPTTTTTIPATTTTTVPEATTTTVPGSTTTVPATELSIRDVVNATPELSVLAGLLNTPGLDPALVAALDDPGRAVTLVAPTNDAIPDTTTTDPAVLSRLLMYHLIDGSFDTNTLATRSDPVFPTLLVNGGAAATVQASVVNGALTFNGTVSVIQPYDLASTAGFVHTVNAVLTPP